MKSHIFRLLAVLAVLAVATYMVATGKDKNDMYEKAAGAAVGMLLMGAGALAHKRRKVPVPGDLHAPVFTPYKAPVWVLAALVGLGLGAQGCTWLKSDTPTAQATRCATYKLPVGVLKALTEALMTDKYASTFKRAAVDYTGDLAECATLAMERTHAQANSETGRGLATLTPDVCVDVPTRAIALRARCANANYVKE